MRCQSSNLLSIGLMILAILFSVIMDALKLVRALLLHDFLELAISGYLSQLFHGYYLLQEQSLFNILSKSD